MTVDRVLPSRDSEFGRRVRQRLRDEWVIWLTTVGRDGTPQPNPVWFVWEDPNELLIYNRADAQRLGHVRRQPRVSLHFNAGADGNDVVVLTGTAELPDGLPPPDRHSAYVEKYRDGMQRVSGSVEAFGEQYPVPLRVRISRVRGF